MGFKGINGLRSAGEVFEYDQDQLDELLKCSEDPIYFIKNYVYINTKDHGMQLFKMWDFQEDLINTFVDKRFTITKYPRQSGKSSTTRGFLLWYAIFHPDKVIAILANKLKLAREQLAQLKDSYQLLPEWMQPGVRSWAKEGIQFDNGTSIICAATSPDGIRGLSINILYLDEFAFVPGHIAEEFIASVFPTVSSGESTKIIVTSTPNGMNHFFRMWDDAKNGENEEGGGKFITKEIPWNAVPGRDEKWAREQIKLIGEIRFNQEFKCDFLGSQSTLIDHTFLQKMRGVKPLVLPRLPKEVSIWELPISETELAAKNWEYAASLDTGMGLYQDNTVLNITLVKSNVNIVQVAKMVSNQLEVQDFIEKCLPLLKAYHDPRLIIEQPGPGETAVHILHFQKEYENLAHFDPSGRKRGLWATTNLKNTVAVAFKSYVQKKMLKIYDYDTITELTSFGRKGKTSWEGLGGNHDDNVMSLFWIVYYVNSPLFFGNIVEDPRNMANDDSILANEEEMIQEMMAHNDLKNMEFHKQELEAGAKYLSTQSDGSKEPDADSSGGGAGIIFRH